MKALTDYPTPETNIEMRWAMDVTPSNEVVDADLARSLERRLAVCREALEEMMQYSHDCRLSTVKKAALALSLTSPLANPKP